MRIACHPGWPKPSRFQGESGQHGAALQRLASKEGAWQDSDGCSSVKRSHEEVGHLFRATVGSRELLMLH
jgi:hypothetical protein